MRQATIVRKTRETDIELTLQLLNRNERGVFSGSTGVGFMDHMMNCMCVHGSMNVALTMSGDLEVDAHHSVEDLGIVLGEAFAAATAGQTLTRFAEKTIPMDESLSRVVIDISARPYLVFRAAFANIEAGNFDFSLVKEFFYAFAQKAGITLHIENLYGENDHHIAESIFKAFAHALANAAVECNGEVLSSKGVL